VTPQTEFPAGEYPPVRAIGKRKTWASYQTIKSWVHRGYRVARECAECRRWYFSAHEIAGGETCPECPDWQPNAPRTLTQRT
jgi:hypothetical protein